MKYFFKKGGKKGEGGKEKENGGRERESTCKREGGRQGKGERMRIEWLEVLKSYTVQFLASIINSC